MLRSKYAKTFMFSICLTVLSSGTALASSGDVKSTSVQVQQSGSESEILQKQQEIDKYVFEQHQADIAKRGITVTHTGPMNAYVEIGITPYTPENADYLYQIFGRDKVKVVEGIQAETMEISATSANSNEDKVTTTSVNDNAKAAKGGSSIPNTLVYTLAGLGLLGGTSFVVKKTAKR
ncbi:MAG: hypothetical protein K0R09_2011 [Clostridiales bacterium]|jgi:hypothetical protein|nr:hypothetical protein [Clostridiales bacterium]